MDIHRVGTRTLFRVKLTSESPTLSFFTDAPFRGSADDPMLYREISEEANRWELSYLPINSMLVKIEPETIPLTPFESIQQVLAKLRQGRDLTPDDHNSLGMRMSFARGKKSASGAWEFATEPNWPGAELHFLLAASGGHWAGFHNLGAMFRNGFGRPQDETLAFHFTLRAVQIAPEDQRLPSLTALDELLSLDWGTAGDREAARAVIDAFTQPAPDPSGSPRR